MKENWKKLVAEALGTAVLVFFGTGTATIFGSANYLAIALTFGLTIVAVYYGIGKLSGGHVNPAISLAMYFDGRMSLKEMLEYWGAQVIGALAGSGLLFAILSQIKSLTFSSIGLGQNGFGEASALTLPMAGAIIAEVVLTCVFVLVVLVVSQEDKFAGVGGFAIGGALTLVHLIGLPLTGTSVNPARSLAPAIILAVTKSTQTPLNQVWVFVVAPFVGAILASALYKVLFSDKA